jgi:hypothetical protein
MNLKNVIERRFDPVIQRHDWRTLHHRARPERVLFRQQPLSRG